MTRYVFIPDLHGRATKLHAALRAFGGPGVHWVLLGDLTGSDTGSTESWEIFRALRQLAFRQPLTLLWGDQDLLAAQSRLEHSAESAAAWSNGPGRATRAGYRVHHPRAEAQLNDDLRWLHDLALNDVLIQQGGLTLLAAHAGRPPLTARAPQPGTPPPSAAAPAWISRADGHPLASGIHASVHGHHPGLRVRLTPDSRYLLASTDPFSVNVLTLDPHGLNTWNLGVDDAHPRRSAPIPE